MAGPVAPEVCTTAAGMSPVSAGSSVRLVGDASTPFGVGASGTTTNREPEVSPTALARRTVRGVPSDHCTVAARISRRIRRSPIWESTATTTPPAIQAP